MSLYNNLLPIGNSFIKQEVAGFFNVICDCVPQHRCSNGNFLTPDRENTEIREGYSIVKAYKYYNYQEE